MLKSKIDGFHFLLILLGLLVFFSACAPNSIYQKEIVLEDNSWEHTNPLVFEAEMLDTSGLFDIYVSVEHLKSYAFENLYIRFGYDYEGIEKSDTLNLNLINKEGLYIGDCSSESCFIEGKVKSNIRFANPGGHLFTIDQFTRNDELEGISKVGLIIRESSNQPFN